MPTLSERAAAKLQRPPCFVQGANRPTGSGSSVDLSKVSLANLPTENLRAFVERVRVLAALHLPVIPLEIEVRAV